MGVVLGVIRHGLHDTGRHPALRSASPDFSTGAAGRGLDLRVDPDLLRMRPETVAAVALRCRTAI